MTQTKTKKLRTLTETLQKELDGAGDGTSNAMPSLAASIERILISEGMEPELTPCRPEGEDNVAKLLIRTWRDEDGKEVAEARNVSLIKCRCDSAMIAAKGLLPKPVGRPKKED